MLTLFIVINLFRVAAKSIVMVQNHFHIKIHQLIYHLKESTELQVYITIIPLKVPLENNIIFIILLIAYITKCKCTSLIKRLYSIINKSYKNYMSNEETKTVISSEGELVAGLNLKLPLTVFKRRNYFPGKFYL